MKTKILDRNIIFNPASGGVDDVGRLFSLKGDEKYVYRNINGKYREFYSNFIKILNGSNVLKKYIVGTEISDYTNEQNEIILRHEKINAVNYPWEWSYGMLKDAALMFIDMNIELAKSGYFTKDSHSFNIIFKNNISCFIDLGSITKNNETINKSWISEFATHFIYPLLYISCFNGVKYRKVIRNQPQKGFTTDKLKECSLRILSPKLIEGFLGYYWLHTKAKLVTNKNAQIAYLETLRRYVKNINIQYTNTEWSNYYDDQDISITDKKKWNDKQKAVCHVAENIEVKSVIDLAGNTGFYLDLFAYYNKNDTELFLFDYDEVCIDTKYKENKYNCLVVDFLNIGEKVVGSFQGHYFEYEPIDQRIKGDLVLCLALTHHLVFRQKCSFELIAEKLFLITNKYCLVEFIPKEDIYVSEWYNDDYKWYNLENFQNALEKYFTIKKIYNSNLKFRKILLCQKNET